MDLRSAAQHHWWLAGDGFPQRIAGLLAAPLQATGQPAASAAELAEIFAPLPAIAAAEAHPACRQAGYRYLLCLRTSGVHLSCWRQYPGEVGWQRRCGPMALAAFIRRFGAPRGASS